MIVPYIFIGKYLNRNSGMLLQQHFDIITIIQKDANEYFMKVEFENQFAVVVIDLQKYWILTFYCNQ